LFIKINCFHQNNGGENLEKWIAGTVGKMHVNRIRQSDLSQKLGCTTTYVNMILTGKRSPKGAKERITGAVDELIKQKK
jgi:hypothetical protein